MRLARKAIELGKDDAPALAGGGFGIAFLGAELDAGLALTDRAIALNPNFVAGVACKRLDQDVTLATRRPQSSTWLSDAP